MPRFRVRDLLINIGEGNGGGCELITNCGGVTELCVENTQGCAFTQNCDCTIQTCGANSCGVCTPCSGVTCGCTCTACSFCTACSPCTACSIATRGCRVHSLCGHTIQCTPTFVQGVNGGLQVEHLQALKDELRATLHKVEAQERNLSEKQQPQTVAQVDEAEKKLNEALEALRHRRSELQGREPGK